MQADSEIVNAVLGGEQQAYVLLMARYERAVWATAWRILRDGHAAADAGQEAFLLADQRLPEPRQPEQFGVWFLRITRRQALRFARCRTRQPSRSLDETVAFEPRFSADCEELLVAVARLPERERLVVVLHYLDSRPERDVAAALGRPVSTVTKQLSRAIQRLRLRATGEVA